MMKLGNDAEARGVLKILAPATVILTVPLDARGPKVPLPHSAFIGSPDHSVKHAFLKHYVRIDWKFEKGNNTVLPVFC